MGITMPAIDALQKLPGIDTIICGHSHIPGVVPTEHGTYVNTGSWSFGNSQYGIWDGREFQLHDWIARRRVRDENYRYIFAGQTERPYEDWFRDQYLGYMRFRCGEEALRAGVRPRPFGIAPKPLSLEGDPILLETGTSARVASPGSAPEVGAGSPSLPSNLDEKPPPHPEDS